MAQAFFSIEEKQDFFKISATGYGSMAGTIKDDQDVVQSLTFVVDYLSKKQTPAQQQEVFLAFIQEASTEQLKKYLPIVQQLNTAKLVLDGTPRVSEYLTGPADKRILSTEVTTNFRIPAAPSSLGISVTTYGSKPAQASAPQPTGA